MNESMPSLSPDTPNSGKLKWIIVAVVVVVIVGAAIYLSTQTNLLKGTAEITVTPGETDTTMANDDQMGNYNAKVDEVRGSISGESDLEAVVETLE
ncbi:hypothetical protein KKG71_03650 [Patescibacteria group bacterium]|nr:hypothetical protein [Patescibacteria group bacterium]